MASEEHLAILQKGVEVWNAWHDKIIFTDPESGLVIHTLVDLRNAKLRDADLTGVDFRGVKLAGADLRRANLTWADFRFADLSQANLVEACLFRANFFGTGLEGTNMYKARAGLTTFADVDLRKVQGLETIVHFAPSEITISTIERTSGHISLAFLRGCGVPEYMVNQIPSLVNNPAEYHSCFLSYSSKDQEFAAHLYADLQSRGVRCWFAPHDMRIGDELRPRIDEAIRSYDKLLLILSEHSIDSEWVKDEVEEAYEKERQQKRPVLFPVRLDEAVMNTELAWAAKLRRQRHIGDFRCREDDDAYRQAFERLIRDLKAESNRGRLWPDGTTSKGG
jgi:hypothetical protein